MGEGVKHPNPPGYATLHNICIIISTQWCDVGIIFLDLLLRF